MNLFLENLDLFPQNRKKKNCWQIRSGGDRPLCHPLDPPLSYSLFLQIFLFLQLAIPIAFFYDAPQSVIVLTSEHFVILETFFYYVSLANQNGLKFSVYDNWCFWNIL